MILPGMGTILFGMIGAVSGGTYVAMKTNSTLNKIGDQYNYDIEKKKCESCKEEITIRKYKGDKEDKPCDNCQDNAADLKAKL